MLESGHYSGGQRQAAMLEELRLSDVDGLLPQINIPEPQAHDLSAPQTGAVGKHQHREEARADAMGLSATGTRAPPAIFAVPPRPCRGGQSGGVGALLEQHHRQWARQARGDRAGAWPSRRCGRLCERRRGECGDGCSSFQCSTRLFSGSPDSSGWRCKKRSKRSSNSSLVS